MTRKKSESDIEIDRDVARSRETGGVDHPSAPDQASTTGSSRTSDYVGRIAGDDVGYAEETGAERRAECE